MSHMPSTKLGQGLYDAAEVGWLLGHDAEWAVRWSTPSSNGQAIVEPTFDRLFSFADLVSFRVALLVRGGGVSDRALRRGVQTLRTKTQVRKPLASMEVIERLATSGNSFLARLKTVGHAPEEYEDIGQGGQGVFQEIVQLHLSRIAFDRHGDPERWVPARGVVIDPGIQAGAPCIEGTRIPTETVAEMLADADPEDLALDFDTSVESILLAAEFEKLLADRVCLPV